MRLNGSRRLAALTASAVLLLSACAPGQNPAQPGGDALTWTAWTGYDDFLNLAAQTCRVAFLMGSCPEGAACHAQVTAGSIRDILRDWLAEQKTISPDETRWR